MHSSLRLTQTCISRTVGFADHAKKTPKGYLMKVAISWQSHPLLVTLGLSSLVWGGLQRTSSE